MKHKLTQIKLLVVATLLLLLSSCEKDLYEDAIEQSNVKQVKLSDLPFLQNSIKQQKELNESNKNATDYLSLINPDNIIMITDSLNRKSYTFSLKLEEDSEKLTNLLIQESGTDLEYYLIKYSNPNLEQWKIDLENHQVSSIEPNVLYESLTDTNRVGCETSVVVYQCPSGMHDSNTRDLCNFDFSLWHLNVAFSDVPCGGTFYGTSIPNLGGGGSSTSPEETPCNKLKKLTNPTKADLIPIVEDMWQTIPQSTGEAGTLLIKATNGNYLPESLPQTNDSAIEFPIVNNMYGGIHSHPLDTYPMFSWSDVNTLNDINNCLGSHNQGEAVFLLATIDNNGHNQLYAIVFDTDSLNNSIQQFIDNPENEGCTIYEVRKEMDDKIKKDFDVEFDGEKNYERAFLQFMSNANVSLYKANSTLTNWSQLTVSNNSPTATVNPINCN